MGRLSYTELRWREHKFLDMTSLRVQEFEQLVPAFEEAFQERMKEWRLDGKKRWGRGYTKAGSNIQHVLLCLILCRPGSSISQKGPQSYQEATRLFQREMKAITCEHSFIPSSTPLFLLYPPPSPLPCGQTISHCHIRSLPRGRRLILGSRRRRQ